MARFTQARKNKSSRASQSNSKLRPGVVKGDSCLPIFGCQQTFFHRVAFQKGGGFALGCDFAPQFDGHSNADLVAYFVRNTLDLRMRFRCHRCLRSLPYFITSVAHMKAVNYAAFSVEAVADNRK